MSASEGTGTMISTLLAVERRLNWARALRTNSILLPECMRTCVSTQISGLTWVLSR